MPYPKEEVQSLGGSRPSRVRGWRVIACCAPIIFTDVSVYTPKDFRRRFRMKDLFLQIRDGVREHDPWFKLKKDYV